MRLNKRTHLPKQMRTLMSRLYVVKTMHPATPRTPAKKIRPSASTPADNATLAAARHAAAMVISLPVSIVPGSIGGISANSTNKALVLPMKNYLSRLCLNAVQNSDHQSRTRIFLLQHIKRSERPVRWSKSHFKELMPRREARAAADVA